MAANTEGFPFGTFYGIIPLPPGTWDPDPHWVSESLPYSPPPYPSDGEAPTSRVSATDIVDSLISSTHDLQPASEADSYCTLTPLRAGRPSSSSG
ncbi:hypothetical protein CYMTET_38058 [Cymbomonas tetramitiformis]|uniref:Uncharacterized protein n=1 Tax=Cymbomonas tetramitiformis TaxID=36881 RepID=A0AAE0CCU7_9CHLO|nr:hypothetical protein CYMTET_38058 [Cymbomonas tetramitiformis]